jgi:hypothetical protein
MRLLAFLLALLAVAPSQASTDLASGRRFVLVLFQILESGSIQPILFENNTFTTDQACQRAGQQFVQQFVKTPARLTVSYTCFDRSSAT